jgi:hypothetical protein
MIAPRAHGQANAATPGHVDADVLVRLVSLSLEDECYAMTRAMHAIRFSAT